MCHLLSTSQQYVARVYITDLNEARNMKEEIKKQFRMWKGIRLNQNMKKNNNLLYWWKNNENSGESYLFIFTDQGSML